MNGSSEGCREEYAEFKWIPGDRNEKSALVLPEHVQRVPEVRAELLTNCGPLAKPLQKFQGPELRPIDEA